MCNPRLELQNDGHGVGWSALAAGVDGLDAAF
jgi:hypothetical protein